jgi:hypothetical protein
MVNGEEFETWAQDKELSGQLHAPAALILAKKRPTTIGHCIVTGTSLDVPEPTKKEISAPW